MRHPDDQRLLDELDRVFRRQVAGMAVGGALAIALTYAVGCAGLLPTNLLLAGLVGAVVSLVGVTAGGLVTTR